MTAKLKDLSIVFDLDGTLVDSARDLRGTLNVILEAQGRRPVQLDEVRNMVGQGARALIQEGMVATGDPIDAPLLDRLTETFIEHYAENIAIDTVPFPHVEDLLPVYRANGAKLGVCTNKLEHLATKLIATLKIDHHFEVITGRDTTGVAKPHPLPLLTTIERIGGNPANAVFIGDSTADVEAAKAANIPCILVSFGYTPIPVEDLGGDAIIDSYQELAAVIDRIL